MSRKLDGSGNSAFSVGRQIVLRALGRDAPRRQRPGQRLAQVQRLGMAPRQRRVRRPLAPRPPGQRARDAKEGRVVRIIHSTVVTPSAPRGKLASPFELRHAARRRQQRANASRQAHGVHRRRAGGDHHDHGAGDAAAAWRAFRRPGSSLSGLPELHPELRLRRHLLEQPPPLLPPCAHGRRRRSFGPTCICCSGSRSCRSRPPGWA